MKRSIKSPEGLGLVIRAARKRSKLRQDDVAGCAKVSKQFSDSRSICWPRHRAPIIMLIRAENSMGKSTCARSILVALGMEAMLTTSLQDLPLTPAMTVSSSGRA
ncbi:hypothetical protein [Roseateles chitinivorans]|uniref:hypothetical protein n=1 Tax=Roseateles chitinivorans TaxID=2917965 RepID=UPI003D67995C